ncbi:Bcr/CflA family drug resistance efflux transporter [Idiomarina tyrosinivorans]|uniref:Bcr/CflA family efflux transporter n=1 Tax=Idiomarina tyrosinivorans TaxID=1445662 RepID=A0A432ZLU6_9GAMM|nr:multidrug effflux MFS transporter [Idiomarina tyrosinivorans]RUO78924.1 Bcr/CflA family drug resistance efflux transporter [Idiomarina tyrosinivorans]
MQYTVSDTAKFDLTVVILALLTAFAPLSIDMYLPAFNAIAESFGAKSDQVQLSLTAFFFGLFIGQLLYGTATDKFGRKQPLYFGLVIYIVTSLACAWAPNITTLIILRFLQAVGACAGIVIARAMVRDMYTPQASARVFSFLILVMGVAPILAPLFGAYIAKGFGWQAIFLMIAAIGFFCLLAVRYKLPETRGANYDVRMRESATTYWSVLKDPTFLRFSLTGGIAQAGLFAYITGSPKVFIDVFGLTPEHYSWLFGLNACGIIGFSQVNGWLLKHYSARKILNVSLPILATVSVLMWTLAATIGNFWAILIPLFMFIATLGLVFPNAMAGALAEQAERAGSASAVTGSLQFLIAGFASMGVNQLGLYSDFAMSWTIGSCGLASVLCYALMRKPE